MNNLETKSNDNRRERKFKTAQDVRKFLMKLYYQKYQDLPNSMITEIITYKLNHGLDNSQITTSQLLGNSNLKNSLLYYNKLLRMTKKLYSKLQERDSNQLSEEEILFKENLIKESKKTINELQLVILKGKTYYKELYKNKKGEN